MLLDLPVIVDLVWIQQKRQLLIDENLRRQNNKRQEWTYKIGQRVLVKTINPNKLAPRTQGPYTIVQVYTNGTVDIRRNPLVVEQINIRRLVPYRQ